MGKSSNDRTPTQEQIARRAYEIFEQRGCPAGRDLEHWLEAEAQLNAGEAREAREAQAPQPAAGGNSPKSPRRPASRQPAGIR